jgi:hypothetical protein
MAADKIRKAKLEWIVYRVEWITIPKTKRRIKGGWVKWELLAEQALFIGAVSRPSGSVLQLLQNRLEEVLRHASQRRWKVEEALDDGQRLRHVLGRRRGAEN